MKKTIVAILLSTCALTPFVIAACPSPNYPTCPSGVPLLHTEFIDIWTCCDQTKACSTDGTKYPRFRRGQGIARYRGTDGNLHDCVTGAYVDGPEISCCD